MEKKYELVKDDFVMVNGNKLYVPAISTNTIARLNNLDSMVY